MNRWKTEVYELNYTNGIGNQQQHFDVTAGSAFSLLITR
jgi:hypothetical protein